MAINNLNPRRTVWFSPHEPSNKYDIWLSKNAHYDENGEPTTDSNAQRDCDYIFKIYDCGKWNPIVGFNSTAANKINTVASAGGYAENHVPLFGDPTNSPDELVDGGTIGDVLINHMTEQEWKNIILNGGLGEAITTTINAGVLDFDLWAAESNRLGGIMMNTFPTVDLQHFSEIKYYNNSNKHPFADVSDIVSIINSGNAGTINGTIIGNENWTVDSNVLYRSFYNSPSIRKGWDETQGSTSEVKPRFELNGSLQLKNRGKFLKLKDSDDQWWGAIEHNYGDNDNCFDWVDLKDWFDESSIYDMPIGSAYGINTLKLTIFQETGNERVAYTHMLDHYSDSTGEGKVCVTKFYNEGNAFGNKYGLEWLEPNLDFLSDVKISNPTLGQSLVYDGNKWVNGDTSSTEDTWRPIQVNDNPIASDYTFDIHSGIGIAFSTTQSNREAVCKIELNVQYNNENDAPILTGDLLVHTIPTNTSYPHGGCLIEGTYLGATGNHYLTGPYVCRTVLYNVTSASKINFKVAQTPSLFEGNPVYYKLKITGDSSNVSISFVEGSEYIICDDAVVSGHLNAKFNNYFITIQFGIVKIEPIMIQSSI